MRPIGGGETYMLASLIVVFVFPSHAFTDYSKVLMIQYLTITSNRGRP